LAESLFAELKRRNVIRVGIAYLAGSWLVLEVARTLLGTFGYDESVIRFVIIALAIGLIPTLVFSWVYELTSEGLKKESEIDHENVTLFPLNQKLDFLIIGLLVLSTAYFIWESRFEVITVAPKISAPSIAVLPFADMSPYNDQGYFSDGLSEDLLNLLAKVHQLKVIARSSSFSFRDSKYTVREIAEKLNVTYVLEGSVRKSGSRVRVTAQLIKAETEAHVWSDTYTRELDDIFTIQDEISSKVVSILNIKLRGKMPSLQSVNAEAYDLYKKLMQLLYSDNVTAEGIQQAFELGQKVLELAPEYTPALLEMSKYHLQQGNTEKANELLDKAYANDPDYAPLLAYLGEISLQNGDIENAAKQISHALALDPAQPEVLKTAAGMYGMLGRPMKSIELHKYIIDRNPLVLSHQIDLTMTYFLAHKFDDAISLAEKLLHKSPETEILKFLNGASLNHKGEYKEALSMINSMNPSEDNQINLFNLIGLVEAYHGLGEQETSDLHLKHLINKALPDHPYSVAWALAFQGDADGAFKYLDMALEAKDPFLKGILNNPGFIQIHSDPRWLSFLERLGLHPNRIDAIEIELDLPG
jgi:adenylate cyclase